MQHVPAWKRIGLKLKYANDDTSSAQSRTALDVVQPEAALSYPQENASSPQGQCKAPSRKRKISHGSAASENRDNQFARASVEVDPVGSNDKVKNAHLLPESHTGRTDAQISGQSESLERSTPSRLLRRKSVTFTPETKPGDEVLAKPLSVDQTQLAELPADLGQAEPPTKKAKRDKKRPEKLQGKDLSEATTDGNSDTKQSAAILEAVRYLEQFDIDRANWKFNKNKQNNLLKHLFDVRRVSPKHNDAIVQYVSGLQGSAARQRLAEHAKSILSDVIASEVGDLDSIESERARNETKKAALQRHLEKVDKVSISDAFFPSDQTWDAGQEKVAQQRRAELLLRDALSAELRPSHSAQPPDARLGLQDGTSPARVPLSAKPTRKNRKARTTGTSDDNDDSSDAADVPVPLPQGTGKHQVFDDDPLDVGRPDKGQPAGRSLNTRPMDVEGKDEQSSSDDATSSDDSISSDSSSDVDSSSSEEDVSSSSEKELAGSL